MVSGPGMSRLLTEFEKQYARGDLAKAILISTVDTDVEVIMIGIFHKVTRQHSETL